MLISCAPGAASIHCYFYSPHMKSPASDDSPRSQSASSVRRASRRPRSELPNFDLGSTPLERDKLRNRRERRAQRLNRRVDRQFRDSRRAARYRPRGRRGRRWRDAFCRHGYFLRGKSGVSSDVQRGVECTSRASVGGSRRGECWSAHAC